MTTSAERAAEMRRQADLLERVAEAEDELLAAKADGAPDRLLKAKHALREVRAAYRTSRQTPLRPGDAVAMPAAITKDS